MEKLPQSKAPLLMSEVTAPLSPRTQFISRTVEGGRMALPQKLMGTYSKAKRHGPLSPKSNSRPPARQTSSRWAE